MSESTPDYGAYVDQDAPAEDDLKNLTGLAELQRTYETEVEEAEAVLKEAQARLRSVAEGQIPEIMGRLGMATFQTTSGINVTIDEKLRTSVPKARKQQAMDWVEEHGGAEVLRRCFVISFTKEQEKFANKFERDCNQRKMPLPMERNRDVAAPTLNKFVRDKLKNGDDVPLELFGGYWQKRSKIKIK